MTRSFGGTKAGPVSQTDRTDRADVLRDVVLLGMLVMNIQAFA